MKASGGDFGALAATLHPEVVLHQSSDLPWGGESHGHAGYEDWARQMSAAFNQLEVKDLQLFARGHTVVAACRLVTRARDRRGGGRPHDAGGDDPRRPDRHHRPFYWNVPAYCAAVTPGSP